MKLSPPLTWAHLLPARAAYDGASVNGAAPPWLRSVLASREGLFGHGRDETCRVPVAWGHLPEGWNRGDGLVAFNCKSLSEESLNAEGFTYARRFAVLPSLAAARWFVPLGNPSLSSAALSLYTPTRKSARFKRFMARMAMHLRAPFWYRDSVWIASRREPPLVQTLRGLFPDLDVRLALSAGAPEPARNRKASVVVLGPGGEIKAFGKAAASGLSRQIAAHEAQALQGIAKLLGAKSHVPKVLFAGDVDGVYVTAQTPLPRPADRPAAHAGDSDLPAQPADRPDQAGGADESCRAASGPYRRSSGRQGRTVRGAGVAPADARNAAGSGHRHSRRLRAVEPAGRSRRDLRLRLGVRGARRPAAVRRDALPPAGRLPDPPVDAAAGARGTVGLGSDAAARLEAGGSDRAAGDLPRRQPHATLRRGLSGIGRDGRLVRAAAVAEHRRPRGGGRMNAPATATRSVSPTSFAAMNQTTPAAARADRAATSEGAVVIATLNRPVGDTGVHVHTRVLQEGIVRTGRPCGVVSPFSGSKLWLPIFAVRPLFLKRINKTWGTRWYRHWHAAALRTNLRRRLKNAADTHAVIAQCPVSARVALNLRNELGGRWPVVLVCHFNHSEAREYRAKGELRSAKTFDAMMAFEDAVLREVDQVVYVSGWARDVVQVERGVQPRASRVIWNGLPDLKTSEDRNARRKDLNLAPNDIAIINVGSLEPRKNQLALLDLFAGVAAESPNTKLLLVGDGASRPAIETRIRELNLNDKVTLLGMRHDVPALLGAADIYMHYATAENCPVVLVEAARAGLPVAAMPAGGVPELQREIGGIDLSLAGDLDSSLAVLRPLLSDAATRKQFGDRARQAYERRFALDAMVAAYLEAIAAAQPEVRP